MRLITLMSYLVPFHTGPAGCRFLRMRLAFISDIHEDYPNLKKILSKAESRGYDKLVCLGDIGGFSKTFYRKRLMGISGLQTRLSTEFHSTE